MSSFLEENKEININILSPSSNSLIKKSNYNLTPLNNLEENILYTSNYSSNYSPNKQYNESILSPINYQNITTTLTTTTTPLQTTTTTTTTLQTTTTPLILSSSEKRQKELEESEQLAWRLMEEESMRAYEMQIEFMRNNPELFSQEELQAFNTLLQENNEYEQNQDEGNDNIDEEEDENEEGEEGEDGDNSGAWTYDNLLEIARIVGDVKTERWRLRSDAVFQALPHQTYENIINSNLNSSERTIEPNCSICMDEYNQVDECVLLPCKHYFHSTCAKGWFEDNNSCPMCKNKITNSP